MVFSSITFIYYFLPILLLVYFIVGKKYKNIVLLIFSLLFYFYGEATYIWILILSCIVNYVFAILIDKYNSKAKIFLIIGLIFDIGLLFYFKYTNFFIENINNIFSTPIRYLDIVMPIGISFFTFQTISYLIDVYKKEVKVSKNFINFTTYVCLFPQLVAGPIVRYVDINEQLNDRTTTFSTFSNGVKRFIIGCGKKIIIANNLGLLVATIESLENISILGGWLKAIAYTFQIYFDFSGYSDMAIGLGLMFGFKFLENFNYPFISKSITEFWRRWHISLSSFLRDYVYFPLGGNRVSAIKWFRNLFVVWLLTGFWHGASWNFILWGLYFAILLIIEKVWLNKYLTNKIISHIYTMFFVIISFVIFSSLDLETLYYNLNMMFNFNNVDLFNNESIYYFKSYFVLLLISTIASTPILVNLYRKIVSDDKYKFIENFEFIWYFGLLFIVTSFLVDASFNPFLYFRF